ncbi:MAG: contractile injection system protein, VgrG/Pvc8 family [Caldilineaceae bacterium]
MPNSLQLPDLRIRINGRDLSGPVRLDIKGIAVHEDLDAASMFAIDLYNWNQDLLRITWSDDPRFMPGNQVELWLGYVDALQKVMTGDITSLEPAFQADEIPMVTIRGYDRRHRLLRGRQTRSFAKMKDSAIASKIAGDAGLQAKVKDSQVTHDYVLQHNQTDLAFLQERARRIGYEVYVRDKKLYFQPRQAASKEVATLRLSQDIIEFFPRLTTMSQVSEVAVQGWDVMRKAPVTSRSMSSSIPPMAGKTTGSKATSMAFGASRAAQVRWPVASTAEADQMARGQFDEMSLHYIHGEVVCEGRADLHAGDVVRIEEAGETFSGAYYITSVIHTMNEGRGYETRLFVQRNAG